MTVDLDALADEQLDGALDPDEWSRVVAEHGEAAEAALVAAQQRRAAIADLVRPRLPAAAVEQIIAALPPSRRPFTKTQRRWWLPLGAAGLVAAALTLTLLPADRQLSDHHLPESLPPSSRAVLTLDDKAAPPEHEPIATEKPAPRLESPRARAGTMDHDTRSERVTVAPSAAASPGLSADEVPVPEELEALALDLSVLGAAIEDPTRADPTPSIAAQDLAAETADEALAAAEAADDEHLALLRDARRYLAEQPTGRQAEAASAETLTQARRRAIGPPTSPLAGYRLELARDADGTVQALIRRDPDRHWPNLLILEGLDASGQIVWIRALATAPTDLAEAQASLRRFDLLQELAPAPSVRALRLGLDEQRGEPSSLP